nr:hypothetical protein [Tanacetum cinerariifolium]
MDDHMFTKIKLVSRHQNTQQYGAILPIKLTNEAIRNSESYKEYYAIALGTEPPKTKASIKMKQSSSDTRMPPPTAKGKRVKTSAKVDKHAKENQPAKTSKAKAAQVHMKELVLYQGFSMYQLMHLMMKKSLRDNDDDDFIHPKFSTHYDDDKEEESFDPIVQTPSHDEKTDDEDNDEDSHGMNVEGDEMDDEGANEEDDDVPVTTTTELPLLSATTFPPPPTFIIPTLQETPVPSPANVPSSSLQDLPKFGSLFGFNHRLKALEINFSEFMQTNQFTKVISLIPGIVDKYLDHRMNEAMKVAVELQMKMNNSNLFELELKKILIEKIESNKSIYRSDEQKNLYKALVDAYECDKIILDTYGDTITLKRRQDDEDKDEEPSSGSNRGSKRRRDGKEPESISTPKEKTSKTTSKSTEGSKSHHKPARESAPALELMHTAIDLEEPTHQEFDTSATHDQPVEEAFQHHDWFHKQAKPLTPNRALNKTFPATHGPI